MTEKELKMYKLWIEDTSYFANAENDMIVLHELYFTALNLENM